MTSTLETGPARLLLFGQDRRLVETRQWVLEQAGFEVRTALRLADLGQIASADRIGLFVLCDSLSRELRSHALELIHTAWTSATCLVITPYALEADPAPMEMVFPAMEGPGRLIAQVRTLMQDEYPHQA